MVKSPGPKRAMSSSSLAGLRGGAESEREEDPSGKGGDRTLGLETREADEEGASSRHDWFVAWCLMTGADPVAPVAADERRIKGGDLKRAPKY